MSPKKLDGRIALITGASRGIGAAVARLFASQGAHVVLTARTTGGLEETDDAIRSTGGAATLVPLDLREFDQIDRMGAAIAERFGRLDILVGNAAVLGVLGPTGHMTPEVWQEVMDVNVTANWRLIRSFDPLLRESDAGRAIFVTSGVTSGVFPYWSAYAASKAALETLVCTYAGEVEKTNIHVNLLDPGIVATAMRATAFPGEDPATLAQPEDIAPAFLDLALPSCRKQGQVIRA
ncbi:MAG: SDR family NAD(P)-dependent oxidoreductase [Alphaproteobacteria bacterium]|nr:SDR family NAD(P)-dependent oxidoreductase [Alphaproteobacteria bacterium]